MWKTKNCRRETEQKSQENKNSIYSSSARKMHCFTTTVDQQFIENPTKIGLDVDQSKIIQKFFSCWTSRLKTVQNFCLSFNFWHHCECAISLKVKFAENWDKMKLLTKEEVRQWLACFFDEIESRVSIKP